MGFQRGRQPTQAIVGAQGKLVVGAGLPIQFLGVMGGFLDDGQKVSRLILALQLLRAAVGRRQLFLLCFLGRSPIRVPGFLIDFRQGSVNSAESRHFGQRLLVEIESAISLLGFEARFCHQVKPVGRAGSCLGKLIKTLLGQSLVTGSQSVPHLRARRVLLGELLKA